VWFPGETGGGTVGRRPVSPRRVLEVGDKQRRAAVAHGSGAAQGVAYTRTERLSAGAAGIASLWENPERRRQFGATGYEGVRAHYSTEQMLAEVMEVYRRLVSPLP
jgi:hypothetical protein